MIIEQWVGSRLLPWQRRATSIFLIAGLTIPVASYSGYAPNDIEYLILLIITCALGLLIAPLLCWRPATAAAVVITLGLMADLYFGRYLTNSIFLCVAIAICILLIGVFATLRPSEGAGIAAAVVFSQIASALILRPSAEQISAVKIQPGNVASVIHIVLDEHGAIDALPQDIVTIQERQHLLKAWQAMGFALMRRAYTTEDATVRTMARIWNPGIDDPYDLVLKKDTGVPYSLTKATGASIIARKRVLDVTSFTYFSVQRALRSRATIARHSEVDYNLDLEGIKNGNVPLNDRLKILIARMALWHTKVAKSQFMQFLMDKTKLLHATGGPFYILKSPNALTAKHVLDQFSERLRCCGERGTYYYVHVLLPHWPYVFKDNCSVLEANAWRYNETHEFGAKNTLHTRRARYRLYVDQVTCTQKIIAKIVDAVKAQPKLHDATILVHGDHGARISINNRKATSQAGYDERAYQLDRRATLLAVKGPNLPVRSDSRSVRLDDVVHTLWATDFASYQAAFETKREDSPFAKVQRTQPIE